MSNMDNALGPLWWNIPTGLICKAEQLHSELKLQHVQSKCFGHSFLIWFGGAQEQKPRVGGKEGCVGGLNGLCGEMWAVAGVT